MLTTLLACATLRDVLPGPPAAGPAERATFDAPRPADVRYTGEPRVPWPILPLQAWGLRYDTDIVLVTRHPSWTMHEYARVTLPDGSLWLAKDADAQGRQSIVADLPDIGSWLSEAPIPRRSGEVRVDDRSANGRLDLDLSYVNMEGVPVTVRWSSPEPRVPSRPRNGNTMGHSRDSVAVLLDLHRFRVGGRAEVTIGGEHQQIKKLLGLVPMKFALAQTQAGFAIASHSTRGDDVSFTLTRPVPGAEWPTHGAEAWSRVGDATWQTEGPVSAQRWTFEGREATHVAVDQRAPEGWARLFDAHFQPALPDLSRPFEGEAVSRFVADVAGQRGHGLGEVRARWTGEDEVTVDFVPTAPRWFADRPMRGTIRYWGDGTVTTTFARVPTAEGR